MRKLVSAAIAASMLTAPVAALAQNRDRERVSREEIRDDRRDVREERRELEEARRYGDRRDVKEERRDLKQARKELRQDRRDWRQYRAYDYNRADPRYGNYYADRYYRDGSSYQTRRLSYNDRVYRGQNGRYYCRRADGTTGLVVGALAGGLLGNQIANGGSKTLGTIIGAGAGGLIGRAIDRGQAQCR